MNLYRFGDKDALARINTTQSEYLRCYLSDLQASWVLEEERYFDRDYLEEHSAYYAGVAQQHSNLCRRFHFFDGGFQEQGLENALSGDLEAHKRLQETYLGFSVVRPLPHAPLGRTVVRWYPDEPERYGGNPRIVTPSREYVAHVLGIPLRVRGLAWQQQDGAVALCATTALWSMLHSSAFDDHHAIPTTSDVTRFAYRSLREGAHVFPALDGLDNRQILEAIARAHLTPVIVEGDANDGFSRDSFATAVAALLRSGYPVLLSGVLEDRGGHMVCVTGFRETGANRAPQDASVSVFYVHDDNLGPNVREEVHLDDEQQVILRPTAPVKRHDGNKVPDPAEDYPAFRPQQIIVGVHEGLHMPPGHLNRIGEQLVTTMQHLVTRGDELTVTVRFARVASYAREILAQALLSNGAGLRAVRRKLFDDLPPMSLYVGVVRIGAAGKLIADVLVDASDTAHFEQRNSSAWWRVFGTVVYSKAYQPTLESLAEEVSLGQLISDAAS